jgi:hypothetical protein
VIIVTHNANIAVLGDAELVIPLRSTSDKTSIVNRGSIDRESIQKDCCAILEGGERAFLQRQDIYSLFVSYKRRMFTDWFSTAHQASHKFRRYASKLRRTCISEYLFCML